jgi:NADH-quinone oxidoreductase subunit F
MPRIETITDLQKLHDAISAERQGQRATVGLCGGTGCLAAESAKVNEAFRAQIQERRLEETVELRLTGCRGFCEGGPVVEIRPQEIFYVGVRPEDAGEILEGIVAGKPVSRLLYVHPATNEPIANTNEIPFYKKQRRLVFRHSGLVDPTNIRDYLALGGYASLAKALRDLTPEQVVEEVEKSGLRGRGGGGFPTGRKWRSTREVQERVKYVICNADEGDPGAFMDRSLLEGDPHCVIEGMSIGAFAIGATQGVVYVRQEYPLAVKNLAVALGQAREYGLLGANILGTGFNFDIRISRGGGAFVCGESSALISSIEGKPGEPRAKHVHMAASGLWDKPTCLNNVETWGNVPLIIERGADWFAGIGTKTSTGTKVFSLVGKIQNTGLVEVPMGVTLREMIFDIGGGIPGGRRFKAVQTGGPSGGCLPETALDLPVDFDSLSEAGAMMGSGGMIVMDQDTCMVDVARYFLSFLRDESCGKCTSCREGLDVMYGITSAICAGKGQTDHIAQLEELSEAVRDASMCALGTTSVNPVLSTLRYFKAEYEAHIREHRCPAGVCKALITYGIDPDKCTGCMACRKTCSAGAITGEKKKPQSIAQEKCSKCGACRDACKFEAVTVR